MDPKILVKEYQSNLLQDVENKILTYMQSLRAGSNFFILPVKKTIEKEGDYLKRVSYRCIVMSDKGKDVVFIDSDWLLDIQNFQKMIMKYVGLEVSGIEGIKGGKSSVDIKPRLQLLKKFLDFCDTNGALSTEERVSYFGYSREDGRSVVFANGTLDLAKSSFLPKKASIKNPNAISFECEDALGLADSIGQFSKFPEELLKNDLQKFALAGFMGSSIWANEFFDYFKNYPQLYIFGVRGCGKSFLLKTIMGVVGFIKQEPTDLSKITPFALLDMMESLSRFFVMDDFSVAKNKTFVNNVLRSNYDRLPSPRGSIGGNYDNKGPKTDHYHNDCVMITGSETLPNDEALLTRMVIIEAEKGYTHEFNHREYEEFVAKYRKLFFSIIKNKCQLNIEHYIDQAYTIIEKHGIIFNEQRTKNNVVILIAGNLILGQTDGEWIVKNVYAYLNSYDKMFKINNVAQAIINDIVSYPDEYLSLEKFVIKQQKYPLFIADDKLFIWIRLLIGIYKRRYPAVDIDLTKLENEFKALLGISGKVGDNETNYNDFNGKRDKGLAISFVQVKTNKYLSKLWNAFLSKLEHDSIHHEHYMLSDNLEMPVKHCLELHYQIDADEIGEIEKQEK